MNLLSPPQYLPKNDHEGARGGGDKQNNPPQIPPQSKPDTESRVLTRLREAAVGAEDEQLDVLVHQLLQGGVGVRAIHDRTLILLVVAGLPTHTHTRKCSTAAGRHTTTSDAGEGAFDAETQQRHTTRQVAPPLVRMET